MSVPLVSPYGQCLHFLGYLTWNGTLHFSRTTKEKSIKSRFRNLPAVLSYFIEDCSQNAMRYCLWGCFFLLWRTKNRNNFTGFLVFSIVFLLLGKKCPCKRLGNQAETESVCLWLFKKGGGDAILVVRLIKVDRGVLGHFHRSGRERQQAIKQTQKLWLHSHRSMWPKSDFFSGTHDRSGVLGCQYDDPI